MIHVTQRGKQALRALGFYRQLLHRNPYPGVAVLTYHGVRDDSWPAGSLCFEKLHVTASRLASHCECLIGLGCTVLSLEDWRQIASGDRPLPPRAVLITFDDGYRNLLTCGLPVLERFALPAAVFVCSRPVERQVLFWFDATASRHGEDAVSAAKELDYVAWRELVDRVETPAGPADPHAPLTVNELRRLAAHPLVEIGAHSASHPILARAPIDVQHEEIATSRSTLERWIGSPVTAFAYPNGRSRVDYTDATTAAVAACGLADAFSTDPGFANPATRRFEHRRFVMLDSVNASELAHRLARSWRREEVEAPCGA